MKRILIVSDDMNTVGAIRLMLDSERSRCQIKIAADLESATQAADQGFFDLVLADASLREMNGVSFLRWMRDAHPACARLILAAPSEINLAGRAGSLAYCVLAKPLQATDLVETIDRIALLQDAFAVPELRALIGNIGALPSLSSSYTALNTAVRDPNSSMTEIACIINRDIAMTAKVLQLVNSGFFGLAQKITSVQTAASFLGMDTVKNLALCSETFRLFVPHSSLPRSFIEQVHAHAYRTATVVCSFPLAKREREVAVVGALLQDVGELVLASRMPEVIGMATSLAAQRKCARYAAEESLLGTTHAEIGAYLLGLWGIDGQTVEAVAHHHCPARIPHRGLDSSAALYLASLIARELELHPRDTEGKELTPADIDTLDALSLSAEYAGFRARAVEALANNRR